MAAKGFHPVKEFKPGQSGNPKGAPKREWTWASEYIKAVEKMNLDGVSIKEGIAESLAGKALEGDVNAIKELANRMDGMPNQSTDITTGGDKLELLHIYKPERNKV